MKKLKQILLIFIAFKITVLLAYLVYEHCALQLLHFEHQATEDVQFNDIYYATNKKHNALLNDKAVVLINTGSIPNDSSFRKKLAILIYKVAENKPKAIGLDFYFPIPKNPINDSLLKNAIIKNNVVTVVDYKQKHVSIFHSDKKGLMNFPGKEDETIREYYNYKIINNDTIPSFAAALCNNKSKDSTDYLKYNTENNGFYNILDEDVKINPTNFPAVEASEFIKESNSNNIKEIIYNKIVIIGHLGTGEMGNQYDVEDKFRVPTDKSLFNRNLTMPGAIIHANAVQMMLDKDEMIAIEGWKYELITSILLFGFLFLFYTIHHKYYLSKLINILIILGSTIPIILICCVYLMDLGIYYKIGSLFMQLAFLDEFIDIAEGFKRKFNKTKNHE